MTANKEIKTIGVLTSGGDAPGMNAAGDPCGCKKRLEPWNQNEGDFKRIFRSAQ